MGNGRGFRVKIYHRKLSRFMLAGAPAFLAAVPLNYFLVHQLAIGKPVAYAIVLALQTTVNFFICRAFVFQNRMPDGRWKSFFVFFNGIAWFRLGDWLVYATLTNLLGLPFLAVQLFNVALFAWLKFEFARRVFESEKAE
jgi:putative flippase GtrA